MSAAPQHERRTGPRGSWVQTERSGHEAWASLTQTSPKAAQLLHVLVAHMDEQGALVTSQKVLAQLCDVHVMTIRRAIDTLTSMNFIQTVRVGGERGGALAYIVNSRVAWADKREKIRYAKFSAMVLVSSTEQEEIDGEPLLQLLRKGQPEIH